MAETFLGGRVAVVQADITTLSVDAIVNAANRTLLGGGGVDGAIHRRAGRELLEECRGLNGCDTGDAKATSGYNLPATWVFHTVGPVWHGGHKGEAALLASCYRRCLELAVAYGATSVAFPAVSTGVYRYPKIAATTIAIETVSEFLACNELPVRVVFCCFSEADRERYQARCVALLE